MPPLITGDWSPRSGYEAGLRLAGRGDVTAVFCANDQRRWACCGRCTSAACGCPEDVSVVGFDDIPEAAYLSPPLTTVRQDFDEVGRRCLAALLDLLDADGTAAAPRHPRVAPTLVVRASSGPRRP